MYVLRIYLVVAVLLLLVKAIELGAAQVKGWPRPLIALRGLVVGEDRASDLGSLISVVGRSSR